MFAISSAPTMPFRVTLVEDLVPIILDSTLWTATELVVLSLVSPAWLHPVRKCLYRHPTITSENQCRYLVRTLQSAETLQSFVKGINLWLEQFPVLVRGVVAIRFALNLDGLESFSFLSPTATFLMQKITRHRLVQRIRILPLKGPLKTLDSFGPRSIVEWHPQQAAKFISLKKLTISGATLHITPPSTTPYEFHLSDLIISRCAIIYGSLPQLLHPMSWSHLRSLFILVPRERGVVEGSEKYGLGTILSHCEHVLQCFHLEYQSTRASILVSNLFQDAIEGQSQLVSLRKLHLVNILPRQSWSTILQKIGRRCPNLEVLKMIGCHLSPSALQEIAAPVDIADARLIFPRLISLETPGEILRSDGERSVPFPCGEAADEDSCDEW